MRTIREILEWAIKELLPLGPEEASASAELLMAEITGLGRSALYLEGSRILDVPSADKFFSKIMQRKERQPLAYLVGSAGFWKEDLEVGPDCLIPRPETEVLIEKFLENSGWGRSDSFRFLDLGTGSGAIAIALLREYPQAHGWLSDISPEALEIAGRNIRRYQLESRAELVESDLFGSFGGKKMFWDVIVSNPPYFSDKDWEWVEPEIFKEPRTAFEGGPDGLNYYRSIAKEAPAFLRPEGLVMLEMGKGQSAYVAAFLKDGGFQNIQIFKDHLGIDRVITAILKG